jgi:hypothetical protein
MKKKQSPARRTSSRKRTADERCSVAPGSACFAFADTLLALTEDQRIDLIIRMSARLARAELALRKIASLSTDQLAAPNQCSAVIIAMDALPNT